MKKSTIEVYRIFISSTAIDLRDHRKLVSDSIVALGNLPIGMESFGAQPSDPVDVCLRKVQKCNALVVMVAHRYGWVPTKEEGGDGHKSITWLEVEQALNNKIPVFAFLVDPNFGWTQTKEQDLLVGEKDKAKQARILENIDALEEFKNFLENKAGLVREKFTTPEDLALKVNNSLTGWILDKRTPTQIEPTKRIYEFREVHPLQPAPHFQGREALLDDLDQWWKNLVSPDRVRSLVAIGGAGKTAIVEQFLKKIRNDKQKASTLIWSFYEDPNTDRFLRAACVVFAGEEGEGAGGRLERLQRALKGGEPHLLVLDGLERVQSIGISGRARGDLEDHQLKGLLRSIAQGLGRTRALITSRFKLTDLEQWEGAGYRSLSLDELDQDTAIGVLKAWKVKGEDDQLAPLVESIGCHALSVSILGSFLHHFCDGDPKAAEEMKLDEITGDDPQAGKLQRILTEYAENLPDPERDLIIRLSLFPKGVSIQILGYIIEAGGRIAGALIDANQIKLNQLAKRLYEMGLVFRYDLNNKMTYTAHPFLRGYFKDLLGVPPEKLHEVVRDKISVGLDSKPENKPTDPEVLDKYEELIEHTVLAGDYDGAFDIYNSSIGRSHIYHVVGDYGRMIRICSFFSKDGTTEKITKEISVNQQAQIHSSWAMAEQAQGNLKTSEKRFEKAFTLYEKNGMLKSLATTLRNLSFFNEDKGLILKSKKLAKEAIVIGKPESSIGFSYNRFAHSLLLLGETEKAMQYFEMANKKEIEAQYYYWGTAYSAYYMATGKYELAKSIILRNFNQCMKVNAVRDIAICNCLLGCLCLSNDISKARKHLKMVRDWTAKSGHMDCIIRAHILAAEIERHAGNIESALAEAETGLNQAEGCGYGKFAIDLHILLAKINLAIPDSQAALRHAREALDRSQHKECQYAWGEADGLHLCGICHQNLNEVVLARQRFEAAIKVRERIQHPGLNDTKELLDELNR